MASRSLFDSAEAEAHQSRARVDRLKVVLGDAVVRAPFAGVVVAKNVELGEVVAPLSLDGQSSDETGSIATIADLRTLEVEADVNESNLGKLSDDQPAVIEVDAYEGRSWRGKLRQIVPVADRAKGIVQVKIAFVDPPEKLLPEMSASVSFLEKPLNEEFGKTIVMVTHDPKAAARARSTLHLDKGVLAEQPELLAHHHPHPPGQ